jgi:hypothetical protein
MKVSRRAVWWTVGIVSIAVLFVSWILANYERESYERRTKPERAAIRDPYLRAEMLLGKLGYHVSTSEEASVLDALPRAGTLILSSERAYHLTPERAAALLAWVDRGGYLIADATSVAPSDPILRAFDVRLRPVRGEVEDSADDDEEKEKAKQKARERVRRREIERRSVIIPDYGRPLSMRASVWAPLYVGDIEPQWSVADKPDKRGNEPMEVLHFARGDGRVTLINGLWRFRGGAIEQDDHAEILAALLARYQPGGEVRIMSRLTVPSLWSWLAQNATAALASAATLFVFWLWRIIPRFGVLRPEPSRERRSLVQHLRAVGRFLWRQQHTGALLEAARVNLRARLAARGLASSASTTDELADGLSRTFALDRGTIAHALAGDARSADQFAAAMATISELERRVK